MEDQCIHCKQAIVTGAPFCHNCGTRQRARRGPSLPFLVLVFLLIGGAGWYFYSQHAAYAAADEAIEAVMDACHAGNRAVLAEKVVEAERAFRELPSEDRGTYQVKLDNRMKFVFCE